MKAVIMAGGFGTRLRPLTEAVPKPCVTVMGEPCIVRMVRQLAAMGIREFHISLYYLPEQVKATLALSEFGALNLVFHEETVPLGTAGSVRNCLPFTEEEFIVVSGDAVFDFDLSSAIAFHHSHGGPLTVLSSRVSDPGEYGVLLCDDEDRVLRIIEKPDWSHAYSDDVNTGIYLASPSFLDFIPKGACDFSRDVFPKMLQQGIPIFRHAAQGYWCDIGTVSSYLECNHRLLQRQGSVIQSPIDEESVLESPCYIGKNVVLHRCHIGPNTVVEDDCVLDSVRLEGCVLHASVQCKGGVSARNAVFCKNSLVQNDVRIGDNCVVGSNCNLGQGVTLAAGVKIYPSNRISPNLLVTGNVHHRPRNPFPEDGKIYFPFGEDFGGAMIYEIGRALALLFDGDIVVGRGEQKDASSAMTFCGGALSCGKNVYDTGVLDLSRFRFSVRNYAFRGGVYLDRNYSNLVLRLYDADGMPLSHSGAKKMLRLLETESPCGISDGLYRVFRGGVKSYASFLRSFGLPKQLRVRVTPSPTLSPLLPGISDESARERMRVGSEWVRIEGPDGEPFDENLIRTVACVALGFRQSPVFVSEDFPAVLESAAKLFDFRVVRVSEEEENFRKTFPLTDPNVQALLILGLLEREQCSFEDFASRLPPFAVKQRDVVVSAGRSGIMRHLVRAGGDLRTGICFSDRRGLVRIIPKEHINAFRVVSEASGAELAEELCDYYSMKLKGLKPD